MSSLTFQVESWFAFKPEAWPLWMQHWEEVARDKTRLKLDPNIELYDAAARSGNLHVVTVRNGSKLVGYHVSIVAPMMHYKSFICSTSDMYWLHPCHRNGWAGIKLFETVRESCALRGVHMLDETTKIAADKGRLFEFLGYTPMERRFTKWIG